MADLRTLFALAFLAERNGPETTKPSNAAKARRTLDLLAARHGKA